VAAAFLLLLVFLYFWPFLLRGEVIAPTDMLLRWPPWSSLASDDFHAKNTLRSDVVDFYLPTLRQIKDGVVGGDLPLWTPLKAQGRPLASTLESSFFHPLTLVFVTIFPLGTGYSLIVMSKLFLAGMFTYLFLRKWNASRAGSVVGGVGYMFGGFNIVWLMWPVTLVTSFGPLLFLQTENLVRRPTLGNSAFLSLAVALMVLGGFPSVAGYFFYAVGLYFLVRLIQTFLRGRDWRQALWTGALFSLSFLLGAGITAFQLLPTLELTDFIDISYRRPLSLTSLPVERVIQLVFPNYYGNQIFGNFQDGTNLNETSGYVGIVTLALALAGFGMGLLRRRLIVIFFGALALLSLLLIYGIGPFLGWVSHLPVFNLNPSTRLLSVFGFAAAVSAAFGFDELREFRARGWHRPALLLLAVTAGATLAGMIGYLTYEILERREILSAFLDDFPLMEFHTFRIVTVTFGIGLLMLFVIAVFLHIRRPLPNLALAFVVLLLVSSDLLVFAYRQNPTVAEEHFYPETPAIRFLENNLQPYERLASFDGSFMRAGTQLHYDLNSSFSHTLHSERHRNLILAFSEDAFLSPTSPIPGSGATDFSSPIIDLLGIRFISVPYQIDLLQIDANLRDRFDLVFSRPGELSVYENRRFSPAFLVGRVIHMEDPEAVLATIEEGEFDPREVALVEEPPPPWAIGSGNTGSSSVAVIKYKSDSVAYRVDASQPSLLVIPELYYPGWKASVDGERTKIYRADYIFRGVFVEGGEHTVAFDYEPQTFRRGTLITLVTLALVAGLFIFDTVRRARGGRGTRGAEGA
jgi:hypothetical protein